MKTKLQIILAILIVSCNSNNNRFSIKGLTSQFPDSTKIYLTDDSRSIIIDSTFIIKNQFQFRGTVDSLTQMTVHTKEFGDYKSLWVENVNLTLDASKDKLSGGHISGSHLHDLLSQYEDMNGYWRNRIDSLNLIIRKTDKKDSAMIQKLSLTKATEMQNKHNATLKFIQSNPDFQLAPLYITGLMINQPKKLTEELFNALSEKSKNNTWGKSIRIYLDKSVDLKIGDQAIDFKLPDIKGNQISLSSFRGKYLLLEFWYAQCGFCRIEHPYLLRNYREYNSKGFEILGVTIDVNKELWESVIKTDTIIWPTVSDLKGQFGEVPIIYNVFNFPKNFLINPEGRIIGIDVRKLALTQKLDSIFKN